LRIVAPDGGGSVEVAGKLAGRNAVAFAWTLERNAELEASIRDVRGIPCRQPLRLLQQVRPDLPPAVTLSDPPPFSLATPGSRLPIAGVAEDDLGLRRAHLLRSVVGFRDRAETLPLEPGSRAMRFQRELPLGALGVAPGQTLEFYLEAADSNPSLAGQTASEVATVRIISDEDYAAMLRTRVTMEHFAGRFQALAAQVESWRRTLREMRDLERSGAPLAEQAAALDRARAEAQRTGALARQLSEDFPIYKMEEALADAAREMLGDFDRWRAELDAAQPGIARLGAMAEHMLAGLGDHAARIEEQSGRAEIAEAAARVLLMAGDFRALLEHQRLLERRLASIAFSARPEDREQLPVLGARQAENERRLDAWIRELTLHAGALPDEFANLRESSLAFAGAATACGAATDMREAADAARNARAPEAHGRARAALDKLEALVSRCQGEGFGGLCEGKSPRFEVGDCQETLAQMLASILRGGGNRPGSGTGSGTAGAFGGDPDDGYWMAGHTPLNIPAFGPPRGVLATPSMSGAIGDRGAGGRGASGDLPERTSIAEQPGPATPSTARAPVLTTEWLPGKYQDAVKRYFSEQEE
jgi:transposase-like protein